MPALPPYVIVHGIDTKLMLGPTGWTSVRAGALSFNTPEEARDWARSERKDHPKLFPNAPCTFVDKAMPEEVLGAAVMTHDYDPHGGC
jgi:hypothetical protein